jgi:hypothetical protein
MNLNRVLAWEIVGVHLLTGILLAASIVLVLLYMDPEKRWVMGALSPFIVFLWLGWAYEAWIIWRMSAEMRGNGGEPDDRV